MIHDGLQMQQWWHPEPAVRKGKRGICPGSHVYSTIIIFWGLFKKITPDLASP